MPSAGSIDRIATALVPSLSRSLAEQFNVFRVMHHGTHEKQLSNVFAWLLSADGTHGLGDAFQRAFVGRVNAGLVNGAIPVGTPLPDAGYRVSQEVDTSGHGELGRDIADIVLTRADASIVVENFESSDGHGHDYSQYLSYGAEGDRRSVVVLLCARHERHRLGDGWEQAVVVTYEKLLADLRAHVVDNPAWRRTHTEQNFFIEQLVQHFLEGPATVNNEDRIAFITTMCETGESARYGYRPQDTAAQDFADLLALHARHQFEDGRRTLGEVKQALRLFADGALRTQLSSGADEARVTKVDAKFQGTWEWCVTLHRGDSAPKVYLEFGPTAVVENERAPAPLAAPDYSKVFVTRHAGGQLRDGIDVIIQTDVGLDEVLAGLGADDRRLHDAVIGAVAAG